MASSIAQAGFAVDAADLKRRVNSSTTTSSTTTSTTATVVSDKAAAPVSKASAKGSSNPDKEIWWANGVFVVLTHVAALASILFYTPKWQTLVLSAISIELATLGITMGYHRLWSHRSYKAGVLLRSALAFMGTLGFQGSIKWWVLRHRLHHRYTDDPVHDPYAATRGFYHSHIGWIFEKPVYSRMKLVDASDLNADPIVRFQHKYYQLLALLSGFVIPTILGSLWGDALGAYLYAGFVVRVIVWHVTFCINSFAHWLGDQKFSAEMSARGTLLLALLTQGEGHHNFHHEFPKDYRNGVHTLDWDPTKWLIWLSAKVGLAWDLYTVPENEIQKAVVVTAEKKAQELRSKLDWGVDVSALPSWTMQEVSERVTNKGQELLVIDGFVLDVADFKEKHPGGAKILKGYYGKDATETFFNGSLNNHSQSARTYLAMLRVAKVAK
ncbi:hypothetical protein HDU96_006261 [Phlyctochytrium bullatum]|nr:hypothetical protein HDU96_006261 [Phlyctochytrium bullatum]